MADAFRLPGTQPLTSICHVASSTLSVLKMLCGALQMRSRGAFHRAFHLPGT